MLCDSTTSSTATRATAGILAIDQIQSIAVNALNDKFEGTYTKEDAMITPATNLKVSGDEYY